MPRAKTELRLRIEEFLSDTDENANQWMSVECSTQQERRKIRSMAFIMRQQEYPIGIIEYDPVNKAVWIERRL